MWGEHSLHTQYTQCNTHSARFGSSPGPSVVSVHSVYSVLSLDKSAQCLHAIAVLSLLWILLPVSGKCITPNRTIVLYFYTKSNAVHNAHTLHNASWNCTALHNDALLHRCAGLSKDNHGSALFFRHTALGCTAGDWPENHNSSLPPRLFLPPSPKTILLPPSQSTSMILKYKFTRYKKYTWTSTIYTID